MSLYDRYPDVMSGHPPMVQRAEATRQRRILAWIRRRLQAPGRVAALEVGVGIGLFARAAREAGWEYTGVDRNGKMAETLRAQGFRIEEGQVPPLPSTVKRDGYDVAYASFVVEHLADGTEAFRFTEEMLAALRPGGLLAIVVPDALSLGLEFWNLDYTHRYPTAERNVSQILMEHRGLVIEDIIRYRAWGVTGPLYWLIRLAACCYSYRFWSVVLRNKTLPYSLYQYFNQDILVFIARKGAA